MYLYMYLHWSYQASADWTIVGILLLYLFSYHSIGDGQRPADALGLEYIHQVVGVRRHDAVSITRYRVGCRLCIITW